LFGPSTGTGFTVKVVPSGSESPKFVKSPEPELLISTDKKSLSTIGGSFTGVTVTKIVSVTQLTGSGVPASQILTTIVSNPTKFVFGVYV
jgi:hypothetical protein